MVVTFFNPEKQWRTASNKGENTIKSLKLNANVNSRSHQAFSPNHILICQNIYLQNVGRLFVVVLGVEVDDHVGFLVEDVLEHDGIHFFDLSGNLQSLLVHKPVQQLTFIVLNKNGKEKCFRGRPLMTSCNFYQFLTPSPHHPAF